MANRITKSVNFIFVVLIAATNFLGLTKASVELVDFFPYDSSEDAVPINFSDDSTHHVRLPEPFKFQNYTYWDAYISTNGLISLGEAYAESSPRCATPGTVPKIMPFWSDAVPGSSASISYLKTKKPQLIRKAKNDIVHAFPNLKEINLSWLFVVTWKNIPGHNMPLNLRNTFQAVLASDESGTNTFVMYFYNQIQWPLSVKLPSVGFDAGHNRVMHIIPDSCTASIQTIPQKSNVGRRGKWIFKVDSQVIDGRSGGYGGGLSGTIQFNPAVISVMGNMPIFIDGMFFLDATSNITCLFRDHSRLQAISTKAIIFPNLIDVACPVPFLYSLGKIRVDVIVTSNFSTSFYQSHIFVVPEQDYYDQPLVNIDKTKKNSLLLSVQWNPDSVRMENVIAMEMATKPEECKNKNSFELVEIVVLEYNGKYWKILGPITPPVINNGVLVTPFNVTKFKELTKGKKALISRTFGVRGKVSLESGDVVEKLLPVNVISGMNVLVNYTLTMENATTETENDFDKACKSWYEHEPNPVDDSLPCPASLAHARMDWRFTLDKNAQARVDDYSTALTAYIQRVPSASGGGSQCIYDAQERLVTSASSLNRKSPMNIQDYWSHYWNDILPYHFCCKWGNLNTKGISYFYAKRPSNAGSYRFPGIAKAVGQGHFTTFDGLSYTFLSGGEFVMVKHYSDGALHSHANEFKMNIIMQIIPPFTPFLAITGLVMQQSFQGESVKVQINSHVGSSALSISVDDEMVELNFEVREPTLFYKGLMISPRSKSDILLTFATGFSINVLQLPTTTSTEIVSVNVIVTADSRISGKTEGLLGNFDGNKENDFRIPDSSSIPINLDATLMEIFEEFGMQWKVEPKNLVEESGSLSLFGFDQPLWLSVNQINYTTEMTFNRTKHDFCGGDEECEFDFYSSSDKHYAEATKSANSIFQDLMEVASKEIKTCPEIKLENADISFENYYVGSSLTIFCKNGFQIDSGMQNLSFICDHGEDKPEWIIVNRNDIEVDPSLLACEPVKKFTEINEGVHPTRGRPSIRRREKIVTKAPNTEALKTTDSASISMSAVFVSIIGVIMIIVVASVFIMEYPPCLPVKQRILNAYRRVQ